MANPDQLEVLKRGVMEWNRWGMDHPDDTVDLKDADLSGMDLSGANFYGADLTRAKLRTTKLYLTTFRDAILREADLTGADLGCAHMVATDVEHAVFTSCKVYGLAAWDLTGKPDDQTGLIVTSQYKATASKWDNPEAVITVDDLQTAQYIHLLLKNENVRNVIDTVTSKAVLLLGRFTEERKIVLDGLREKLRHFDLLPIVFDFSRPMDKDLTETVQTLAGMSRFVIADLTNPKSTPLELEATVKQFKIPYVPIIDVGVDERTFAMLADLQKSFHWVLPTLQYETREDLLDDENLKTYIIDPVNKKREELRKAKSAEPEPILIRKKAVIPAKERNSE